MKNLRFHDTFYFRLFEDNETMRIIRTNCNATRKELPESWVSSSRPYLYYPFNLQRSLERVGLVVITIIMLIERAKKKFCSISRLLCSPALLLATFSQPSPNPHSTINETLAFLLHPPQEYNVVDFARYLTLLYLEWLFGRFTINKETISRYSL